MPTALQELKAAVFRRQRVLAEIYERHGAESLWHYANGWQTADVFKPEDFFLQAVGRLLAKIYSPDIASGALAQLQQEPLVSTIDHHGILNHPFFINSNLIFSLRQNQKYLICLTTSGVSLNNSSWPGSFVLHNKQGVMKRLSFFLDKLKTTCVFAAPALTEANSAKVLDIIVSDSDLDAGGKLKLQTLVREIFSSGTVRQLDNFSDQACAISSQLWQKFFPQAPLVVYLPVESLAARLIIETIIPDSNHLLHQLFFTPLGWQLLEKHFEGSLGAFQSAAPPSIPPLSKGGRSGISLKSQSDFWGAPRGGVGSFLFWGINESGKRVRLHREGSRVLGSGLMEFELSPEVIAQALCQRHLYPTGLVCFLVLLYYRVTCLGGFNQVNWLTDIKDKFLKLLAELDCPDLITKIKPIPTQNFAEANLAFLLSNRRLIKATGIDIYLSGLDAYPRYQASAKELTLKESVESLLPEIYRVITPAENRRDKLLMLTDELIAEKNGMAEKIRTALA